ncbi:MAG: glycosyltransferase family 2 protein [Desulfobacterales bacterium]|nr:glycosyltransferase family 2 protein [Desulfobacterales bacterium]
MKPNKSRDTPLFSVIIPLYNKRPYVSRAIESVRQQTFTDWELIIIDDGSTDGSTSEISKDDARIRVFEQENEGPAAARNHGIREAQGEFVAFLDADDYYYPRKLEVEVGLLHTQKKAEWMLSPFDVVRDDVVMKGHRLRDIHGNKFESQVILGNAPNQLSVPGTHIDGLCIKKGLLKKLKGFNENMRCFEISELITRCTLKQPRALVYPDPLFCIVKLPDSAFTVTAHRIEGLRQMGEVLYDLSIHYPEYSHLLTSRGRRNLNSHLAQLIQSGRKNEARNYLTDQFPYSHDKKWWKLRIASWLPEWLIRLRMLIRNT